MEAGGSLAELTIEEGLYPPFVHIYAELRADKLPLYMNFVTHVRQVIFDVTPEVLFDESADVAPVDAVSQDIARKDHNDDLSYLRLTAQLPTSAIRVKVEREMMRAPEDDVEAAL